MIFIGRGDALMTVVFVICFIVSNIIVSLCRSIIMKLTGASYMVFNLQKHLIYATFMAIMLTGFISSLLGLF